MREIRIGMVGVGGRGRGLLKIAAEFQYVKLVLFHH